MKLKKDDEVIVISGRDKGKIGTVTKAFPATGKVLVSGVNMVFKHKKPDPNRGDRGGVVEKELPLDASNVAIYNQANSRADRVGYKLNDEGKKIRYYKSTGEEIK